MDPSMYTSPETEAGYARLLERLRAEGRVLVAFSGGVDSTFLLHAACVAAGTSGRVLAVTLATPYIARAEIAEARAAAAALRVEHRVLELPFPEELRANPAERCYLCKRRLFSLLLEMASAEAVGRVLDGTNADDLGDHRPGLKALRELAIESPLLDAGLGKAEIRALSRAFGLSTWDKPAAACLLSRIPHGTRVAEEELRRIEAAEEFLKDSGFAAVRVRSHGDVARIEVPAGQVAALAAAAARLGVDARLKALGYAHVALDLAGYRMGSLNETENPGHAL
ncbi:Conserved hypothetical protein CHP00268 [Desulfovibrio sp. X2]|uniref:ATP-dependent sacrificial sulfur transferase LarE n=1 Tax=Desulfovibrio sp. X2 TaxID=941449 RepID=UPI000358D8B0|nr:ATP-dependent sacrificial sulfur transferase LarE [Desulfovibrio sp. X2]EPR39864.1 Conserved hypothetical protein CHP00268 [Desulfovibrio sp. X2]